MALTVEDYQRLKQKADKLQRKSDQATGAKEHLYKQLQNDYDCSSLEEAKKLKDKKLKEEQEAEAKFQKTMQVFESKWGKSLED